MKYRWDNGNKWLYLGQKQQWVVMFDEWLAWHKLNNLTIRSWSLFRIMWDNGAWWGYELDNAILLNGKKYCELQAFVEVVILGIGFRKYYVKKVIFDTDAMSERWGESR
jgi:hypothetical protein